MTKTEYESKRAGLMAQAKAAVDGGKLDDFKSLRQQVEQLDADFEASAEAEANLAALSNRAAPVPQAARAALGGRADLSGEAQAVDLYDSAEYKCAFMAYVAQGKALPARFTNADATTKTGDVTVAIPTSTVQKIYEKMERLGMVLPLVSKTSFAGGMSVPTSSVKPSASWVAEGASSDRQKKPLGSVVFNYYKLRCAISMSYETEHLAYPMFEAQFVQNVADAMVKAKEIAIINGSGSGQPKGILKETPTGNVDIAAAKSITYADLCAAEGKELYDGAVWAMTKATYMSQIAGMVDSNGQPVARVNVGLDGRPEYSILGRRVVLLNPDYMSTWAATVSAKTVVAFLFDFADYVFNSAVGLTTKKYYDEDVDETVIKAIELCDGKCVRTDSLVTVTKLSS